jgi:uncharacterized protein
MKYQIWKSASSGEWYWRLRASNGAIISRSSEGYSSEANALHGIALNKSSANAPVERL